jgi:cytidyltransferase-like protein
MRVIAFGTFDPLHQGHIRFFQQARALGTALVVVVARDSWVRARKHREPREPEDVRLRRVRERPEVDEALLGDEWPSEDPYRLLASQRFDVVALGYDQEPADKVVREQLDQRGKKHVALQRLAAYKPEHFKSSLMQTGDAAGLYDLHLHSTYSDGDLSPADLVQRAAEHKLAGVSITDHNGIWSFDEAAATCAQRAMVFIEGIEVSARLQGLDLHVLGYSRAFDRRVLSEGLERTREGYYERAQEMVRRCQAAGFKRLSVAALEQRRAQQADPVYGSYDVARELTRLHGLGYEEARRLTTGGGPCHVPYGPWALTTGEAIELIHEAGGIAVLAHPGLVAYDAGEAVLARLLGSLAKQRLDGLEVYYPYHDEPLTLRLEAAVQRYGWIATGGSDWHGPGRYAAGDSAFGAVGLTGELWKVFLTALDAANA